MGEFERLIVGLGNPGPEYEFTAHNLGFLVVDRVAERNGIRVNRKDCMALVGQGSVAGHKVMLAKPQTFMNVSGQSVSGLCAKYGFAAKDLVVVYDELDLPWGSLRVRPKGSAAGHNGITDVIEKIGTQEFPRIRLGVHPGNTLSSGRDYLLSRFTRQQKETLDAFIDLGADAAESVIAEGVEKSMAKFNRRAEGEESA